jgi:predicted ester cyclase
MGDQVTKLVERFYADVWNKHDKAAIRAIVHPNVTFRGSLGPTKRGHDEFAGYVDAVHAALGDYRCDIQDLVVGDAKAFARMRFSGIHRGTFLGYEPTMQCVEWVGAALFTVADGLIVDLWVLGDLHGLHQLLERNRVRAR